MSVAGSTINISACGFWSLTTSRGVHLKTYELYYQFKRTLHLNIYSKKKSEILLVMCFCWLPLMNRMTGSQGKQRRLVCTSHSAFRPHPKMSLMLPAFLSDTSKLSLQKKSTYCCVLRCPSPRPQRSTCMSAGRKNKQKKSGWHNIPLH